VVQNKATILSGMDAGAERVELQTALTHAKAELSRLAEAGQSGGPNVVASPSQAAEIRKNSARLVTLDDDIRRLCVALQEKRSRAYNPLHVCVCACVYVCRYRCVFVCVCVWCVRLISLISASCP
jgi:hypothetical protein